MSALQEKQTPAIMERFLQNAEMTAGERYLITRFRTWVGLSLTDRMIPCGVLNFDHRTKEPKELVRTAADYITSLGWYEYNQSTGLNPNSKAAGATLFLPSANGRDIDGVITVSAYGVVNFDVDAIGPRDIIIQIENWLRDRYKDSGTVVKTITGVNEEKETISFRNSFLAPTDPGIGRDSFYPMLDVPMEQYFKEFLESDESVLILIGPSGTGKSSFLRALIASQLKSVYLAYIKKALSSGIPIQRFYESDSSMLIYEDIDIVLGSRESGNEMMAMFLNSTEGIVRQVEKKMIFSTNLSTVDRIDSALLRRGRCFDILKFGYLDPERAYLVEEDMKMAHQDFGSSDKITLAEVLNPPRPNTRSSRLVRSAGFLN